MPEELQYRLADQADLPALQSIQARWVGRDYVFDALPSWIDQRPGGVYLYKLGDRVAGFGSISFPKPGEAWLRGKRIARDLEGRGIGTSSTRFEVFEAIKLGAQVVRLATDVDKASVRHMIGDKLGFSVAAHWVIGGGLQVPTGGQASGSRGALRARRFSAAQWHNTRVRLAVQMAIEAFLPKTDEKTGAGHGPWGLIASPHDPWQLSSFGPMDLMTAFGAGEVVVAGDPAQPAGVMFFREPERGLDSSASFVLRLLGGTDEAVTALLDYANRRCAAFSAIPLVVSLPQSAARPVLNWLGPDAAMIDFHIYELQINS